MTLVASWSKISNMYIYMQNVTQQQASPNFRFCLNPFYKMYDLYVYIRLISVQHNTMYAFCIGTHVNNKYKCNKYKESIENDLL